MPEPHSAPKPPGPRQRLIAAALDRFTHQGIGPTSIEELLERAGVAKMTLYQHFGSKQGLVLAALQEFGNDLRSELFRGMQAAGTPRDALLSIFDSAARLVAAPNWRGCVFARAGLEFGSSEDPVHRIAVKHQRELLAHLSQAARAGGAGRPEELAQMLLCLFDGLLLRSSVLGDPGLAVTARAAAVALLDTFGVP